MCFSNILPYKLEPEYTDDELREIECLDLATLWEDGLDELKQQQECVCLRDCFAYRLPHTHRQVSDNTSAKGEKLPPPHRLIKMELFSSNFPFL